MERGRADYIIVIVVCPFCPALLYACLYTLVIIVGDFKTRAYRYGDESKSTVDDLDSQTTTDIYEWSKLWVWGRFSKCATSRIPSPARIIPRFCDRAESRPISNESVGQSTIHHCKHFILCIPFHLESFVDSSNLLFDAFEKKKNHIIQSATDYGCLAGIDEQCSFLCQKKLTILLQHPHVCDMRSGNDWTFRGCMCTVAPAL